MIKQIYVMFLIKTSFCMDENLMGLFEGFIYSVEVFLIDEILK